MRKKRGQSILEYVIVLTVIVAAIAIGAKTFLSKGVSTGFSNAEATMNKATNALVP